MTPIRMMFGLRRGQRLVPDYLDCKFLNDQAGDWRARVRDEADRLRACLARLEAERDLRARYALQADLRAAQASIRESWRIYRVIMRDSTRLNRAFLAICAREAAARRGMAA